MQGHVHIHGDDEIQCHGHSPGDGGREQDQARRAGVRLARAWMIGAEGLGFERGAEWHRCVRVVQEQWHTMEGFRVRVVQEQWHTMEGFLCAEHPTEVRGDEESAGAKGGTRGKGSRRGG